MPATQPLQIVIAIIAVMILVMAYFAASSLSYGACQTSKVTSGPQGVSGLVSTGCSKWDPFPQG